MEILHSRDEQNTKQTTKKIRGERDLVISDILDLYHSVPFKRKQTHRNFAVMLSPFNVSQLYALLSNMKHAKNPAAMFWWTVKKK